jgi:hypothetical protein
MKLERRGMWAYDIAFRSYLQNKKAQLLECQNIQRKSKSMCSADSEINTNFHRLFNSRVTNPSHSSSLCIAMK